MFDHRIATDPYYPLIVVMNCTITLNVVYLFHFSVLQVSFEQKIATTTVTNLSTHL
jgi:hypothetical protein